VQFGQPIGTFQAVQHMLAGAEVQVRALRSGIELLVPRLHQLGDPATWRYLALLKALAGRTGHHVSQATLQVLGGIGFTEEHEHHRYAKRVLTLAALCGSKEQLAREIGRAAMLGESQLVAVP
jgi:alkylation response protein AidB-like acyl-CoA dehydrogenase